MNAAQGFFTPAIHRDDDVNPRRSVTCQRLQRRPLGVTRHVRLRQCNALGLGGGRFRVERGQLAQQSQAVKGFVRPTAFAPTVANEMQQGCNAGAGDVRWVTTDLDGDTVPELVVVSDTCDETIGASRWDVYAASPTGFAAKPRAFRVPAGRCETTFDSASVTVAGSITCVWLGKDAGPAAGKVACTTRAMKGGLLSDKVAEVSARHASTVARRVRHAAYDRVGTAAPDASKPQAETAEVTASLRCEIKNLKLGEDVARRSFCVAKL